MSLQYDENMILIALFERFIRLIYNINPNSRAESGTAYSCECWMKYHASRLEVDKMRKIGPTFARLHCAPEKLFAALTGMFVTAETADITL